MPRKPEAPVLLVRWYDHTKWILERVDSFLKRSEAYQDAVVNSGSLRSPP
jgi:hypothetical protein